MIIAIDGTAASGKGTLGRTLAMKLGLAYLDKGILYRAVGQLVLRQKLDIDTSSEGISHKQSTKCWDGQVMDTHQEHSSQQQGETFIALPGRPAYRCLTGSFVVSQAVVSLSDSVAGQ